MISNKYNVKKKILIIGPYPPPIGGVSVHIKRFCDYLVLNNVTDLMIFDDSNNKSKTVNDIPYLLTGSKSAFLMKLLFKCNYKIIHYHSHNWIVRFILIIIGRIHDTKIYFTFHSFRDDVDEFVFLKRLIALYVIFNGDYFIAVSKNEKDKLIMYGCKEEKISITPAFISPKVERQEKNLIPRSAEDFIKKYETIITANASGIRFFKSQDLYGLDMCIELMHTLLQVFPNKVGFIFFLPQNENYDYFMKLNNRISDLGIKNNFLFITEKMQMFPILKLSSIFLRPTNSDGDAISVREAIHFKVPVIASDIVERPDGTILFKTRDQKDLEDKVINVINNYNYYKSIISETHEIDYAEILLSNYN